MIKINKFIVVCIACILSLGLYASEKAKLTDVFIDVENTAATKRGARIFFDYCQGCHSLKYMRYTDLANGLKISSVDGKSSEELIRDYFLHSTDIVNETGPILTSMSEEFGSKWFGKMPPDLSLVAKYRGANWLVTYFQTFYQDASRPWGVNNVVFPDVGMPHVLLNLQGVQNLKEDAEIFTDMENMVYLVENGMISREQYYFLVKDLVTFLVYVSEPSCVERKSLGFWVVLYSIILTVVLFFLKNSYWERVK